MNAIKKIIFFCFFLILCGTACAATQDPMTMVKTTCKQMTNELDKHLGEIKTNLSLVESIVRRILVPHFDLVGISQIVVGKNYWQASNPKEQTEFTREFTEYVIQTYANALSSYEGEDIKFYPSREDVTGKKRVQIDSDIVRKNGQKVHVQYRVIDKDSAWLIYDFSVDGVSLVRNYQSQFASTLQKGGMTQLIRDLKAHNARIHRK
jgi:phospholipid transport system substrate-binding protein